MKTRKLWWKAAHRDKPIKTGNSYCCQDHFNLEEDLQNYRYMITMGGYAKLKPGVLPHIFRSEGRRVTVTANNKGRSRQRKRKIQEILTNKENNTIGTSATATATEENNEDGDNLSTLSEKTEGDNSTHSKQSPIRNIGIQVKASQASKSIQVRLVPGPINTASNINLQQSTSSSETSQQEDTEDTDDSDSDSDQDCDTSPDFTVSKSDESEYDCGTAEEEEDNIIALDVQ
ncbi:hypothetical protein Pmani_032327 [Petrolisthes manimaculis]|uniref:THAP-type domain-containing protein n=1 Tax=Petrolisthes manimaculis TaxID=1843537 RepID=A0AAE1NRX7_9EUCA|nr:hypothetical protein Pmani_032327 [Petrolisthes manimaculis]